MKYFTFIILSLLVLPNTIFASIVIHGTAGTAKQGVTPKVNISSLIGHWTFDGRYMSGSTVLDSSGNGNSGTLVNSPRKVPGIIGQALGFDGPSGERYVSIPGSIIASLPSGTISMWIKWIGAGQDGDAMGRYGSVAGRQSNSNFSNAVINLSTDDPATAKVVWNPYSGGTVTSNTTVGESKWRHVVVTFTSGDHNLYLDGNLDGTGNTFGSMNPGADVPLTLGAWIGDGSGYSRASIDNVRIYNRVLSVQEVRQIYSLESGKIQSNSTPVVSLASGLVGYWPFSGKYLSATQALDASGGGNAGTLSGVRRVMGKLGQALSFSNTLGNASDHVVISHNPLFEAGSGWTTSAWFTNTQTSSEEKYIAVKYSASTDPGGIYGNNAWLLGTKLDGNDTIGCEVRTRLDGGPTYTVQSVTNNGYRDSRWHMITCVKNGTTVSLYIDGVLKSSATDINLGNTSTAGRRLVIGGVDFEGTLTGTWLGKIDEVRIYNRALSTSEVYNLYKFRN